MAAGTTTQDRRVTIEKEALATLSKLGGEAFHEEEIENHGSKLILPEGMSIKSAIKYLHDKMKEDEEVTNYLRRMPFRPWDGAWATSMALKEFFGAVRLSSTMGFWGPIPPSLISINSGPDGEAVQVPSGALTIAPLPGVEFQVGEFEDPEHGPIFQITAQGPKRFRHAVEGVFKLIERYLHQHSLYRGKAFDGKTHPDFIDVVNFDRSKVVFPEETNVQVAANVFAPIRFADKLESLGVSSKRAVLVHGDFGTGKTSLGKIVAQEANKAGWTFIMARPGRDKLDFVLRTARLYQPAVVFAEDLDLLAAPESQDELSISRLLDDFDGIAAKGSRLLLILTTNHPDRIHRGMIRPGRLDAMIHVGSPDARGIEKLIRVRIPERMIDLGVDWDEVGQAYDGYLPAFVTEAADRAIRYAVTRTDGEVENVRLTTDDLVAAAGGLRPQWERMQQAPEVSPRDRLGEVISELIGESTAEALVDKVQAQLEGGPELVIEYAENGS